MSTYNPYGNSYGSPYVNPYQQQLMQMQQQLQQSNNGFIHVPSEDVARNYSVAPGGSVTFINDNAPYCYTKTAGFSQFDAPIFRKFRLVEETGDQKQEPQEAAPSMSTNMTDALMKDLEALKHRVEALEGNFKFASQNQQKERKPKNEPIDK